MPATSSFSASIVPTAHDVRNLKAGDFAVNAFGRLAEVTDIVCKDVDKDGRAFVVFYTRTPTGNRMSGALKEGVPVSFV